MAFGAVPLRGVHSRLFGSRGHQYAFTQGRLKGGAQGARAPGLPPKGGLPPEGEALPPKEACHHF